MSYTLLPCHKCGSSKVKLLLNCGKESFWTVCCDECGEATRPSVVPFTTGMGREARIKADKNAQIVAVVNWNNMAKVRA